MPLDAVTLHGLTQELRSCAEGARIDRVQQPEKEVLLLTLYTGEGSRRLLLSASVSGARVHFTAQSFENPAEPPMFCMLLRKHLIGARIRRIEQPEMERMLLFRLAARDEMGDESEKTLAVELIGRSANIVLVGQDGRIIDCLRRMEYGGEGRGMLPGMLYRLPPRQEKTPFFGCADEELAACLEAIENGAELDRELLSRFSGLSPLICRELAFRSRGDTELLKENAFALRETVAAGELVPTLVSFDGMPRDFSFMAINQYGPGTQTERFEDFSSLLDAFYARRDREESRKRRSRELLRSVKGACERLDRKLAVQKKELSDTAGREELRRRAELITANIYRMKKGQGELVCEDYFSEGSPEIRIPLDPLKTPQQNAAALYKDFSRKKAAQEHLTVLIAEGERQREYLATVLDEIERAETERDLADIRHELLQTGYLKKQRGGKKDRAKPQAPLRFLSSDGFEILVGRSNIQNDELTFRTARRTDLWLHTQRIHGSHVILRTDGLEAPERTLEEAASLAAWYSQGREAGRIPVDCTQVRCVKKPAGALPGAVLYTDYVTLMAEASEELAEKLKK
ncbi:MAG: NFACT family protein [Oscillospiraceae bacterium]|nr:NFACT family protein [Oscillospiraceae bacterium]